MIFVTVGEQLPFDRLVRTVDIWAKDSKASVYAQIGQAKYNPENITYDKFLSQEEFKQKVKDSDFIVGHAGMGTIITAAEYHKPLLVMPRRTALGEVRNDHQLASAQRFASLGFVSVAVDEFELVNLLNEMNEKSHSKTSDISIESSPLLIKTIIDFIEND